MTEYDYSPEAFDRFTATQDRIAKWLDNTEQHAPEFQSPFDQPTPTDAQTTPPPLQQQPRHPSYPTISRHLPPSSGHTLQPEQSRYQPAPPPPSRHMHHSHSHSPTRFYAPAPIRTHTSSHPNSSHHSHSHSHRRSSTYIIPTPSQGYTAPGPGHGYTYPHAQALNPSYIIMPPRSKTFQALVSVLPHHLLHPPLPRSVRSPLSSHFSFLLLSQSVPKLTNPVPSVSSTPHSISTHILSHTPHLPGPLPQYHTNSPRPHTNIHHIPLPRIPNQ